MNFARVLYIYFFLNRENRDRKASLIDTIISAKSVVSHDEVFFWVGHWADKFGFFDTSILKTFSIHSWPQWARFRGIDSIDSIFFFFFSFFFFYYFGISGFLDGVLQCFPTLSSRSPPSRIVYLIFSFTMAIKKKKKKVEAENHYCLWLDNVIRQLCSQTNEIHGYCGQINLSDWVKTPLGIYNSPPAKTWAQFIFSN